MGSIKDCKDAGIPASLLIPIRPHDKPDRDGLGAGKAPAEVNNNGEWIKLHGWPKGVQPEVLDLADSMGCNGGVGLGNPDSATNPIWNFAAIDLDLNDGEVVHRTRIINAFAEKWSGQVLLVRETVPHRAMLLVRITNAMSVGRKSVYHLAYKDPTDKAAEEHPIGKLELLATGQQAVIAGIHPSGNTIVWKFFGQETRFRAPIVNGAHGCPPIPAFPTFADLSESISELLNDLNRIGYQFQMHSGGAGETVPDEHLAPNWLTAEKLAALVDRLPNPPSTSRETYVEVMMSIVASKCGIARHRGELSVAMNNLVAMAAAKWSAKWPDMNRPIGVSAYEVELAKWESDWSKYTSGFRTSWQRLVSLAGELGVNDAAAECAQEEFYADKAPPPPKANIPIEPEELPFTAPRSGEALVHVANAIQADLTIVDYLRRERLMDQNVCWIPAYKGWMSWDSRQGWLAKDTTHETIEFAISQELKLYTAKYQAAGTSEAWKRGEVNAMLSSSKVDKVTRSLARCVAVSTSDINKAPEFLQTPEGTYNLHDLKLVPLRLRWELRDTRRTRISPDHQTQTPLFDALLELLADGNTDVIEWLWHYFGYALIGDPKAQCFLVLWGAGGNGKGTLAKVLEYIFGDYCTALDNKVLLESGKHLHSAELNVIRYKRLGIVAEMPKNEKWNESILKKLTGEDQIHARGMGENMVPFVSEAALIIHCNELPAFNRITPAILRRFRMVGTMNTPGTVDPRYADKIIAQESRGILWRCMQYAKQVLERDMRLPDLPGVMVSRQNEVLQSNDQFFGWLNTECIVGPQAAESEERLDELRGRYESYLKRLNAERGGDIVADQVKPPIFRQLLQDRGVRVTDNKGNPIRRAFRQSNGLSTTDYYAVGISLKMKAVA